MPQPLQAQFGIRKPFDGVDFTDDSERLNSYFVANNIGQVLAHSSDTAKREADNRKVAVTISLIVHYDPTSKLILHCDASSVVVGATLLKPGSDVSLLPVAYALRILTSAEKNYSQIERESLAIAFGVTKFQQYLLRRHFTLLTDHKPLITLMGEHKPVPQLASARIKRWSLLPAAYKYTIEFIPGEQNVYADFLSRRPMDADQSHKEQVTVNVMFIEAGQFVNASIASETKTDSVLSKILQFTQHGWPEKPEPVFQPYHNKRLEFTQEDLILLWNSRGIYQPVLVRNFGKGAKWVHGRITETVSLRNFNVQVGDKLWTRYEEQFLPRLIPADQCTNREVEQQKCDVLRSSQTLLDDVSTSTPHPNTPVETQWEHITSNPNASTLKSVPKVIEKVPDSTPPASSPNPPTPKREERKYPLRKRKPPE
ncbi:uncharacterized protein [Acropora muricata]|uniref:uncharacterized protein LOC122955893 n=1 Tax=Acropora millepora TaxID=45264 RepID=UPI001CF312BD|nr:uncharacterized protein LOC122955893 [Acropora millepora]